MKPKKTNEGKKKKQARKLGVPVHLAHRCSQSGRRWLLVYNRMQHNYEFKRWQMKDLQRVGLEECGSEPSNEGE